MAGTLNKRFTATLQKGPGERAWTYLAMPDSAPTSAPAGW